MAKVTIRFSEKFKQDLEQIEEHFSDSAAEKRIKATFSRIEDLKLFPLMGRPVPELQDANIRQVDVFREFRLMYHVVDDYFLDILTLVSYRKNFDPEEDLIFD